MKKKQPKEKEGFAHNRANEKKLVLLFSKRIEKGIKYLDTRMERGKWLQKLNPITLALNQSGTCVCGQIFGSYFSEFPGDEDGTKYGFYIEDKYTEGGNGWSWDLLLYLWALRIVEIKHKNGFKV